MKVLVTGAGGFLGLHLVKQLLKRGYAVSSLARGHYPELIELGVTCFKGSITDKVLLKQAVSGQDAIFHVASKVAMWGRCEDFYETNVTGTRNILEICKELNISKFIYTSTPSVVFESDSIEHGNEELPYPTRSYSRYARSKAIAEEIVINANTSKLRTISLRPHLIFGPGDQNLIPRLVESARKNRLKIIGNGENLVDVLYVDNAVDAHLCALDTLLKDENYKGGQAYFIGQGPIALWPFINSILAKYNLPPITRNISFKRAYRIGAIIEFFLRVFRINNIHPPMTRFVALQLAKSHYFSHDKASKDLGWKPRVTIEEALSNLTI